MKKVFFAIIFSSFFFLGNAQSLQEGINQMENENYATALTTFNNIARNNPKDAEVYFYIGEVHYKMENYTEAEKAYRKGMSVDAGCVPCNVGVGKLQLDKGNPSEAQKYFDIAVRSNKKAASTYGFIGDAYLYSKKPNGAKAIEFLTKARDMDVNKAVYWSHLGEAYQLVGDNGEAMSAFERAVEKDPTNAEAYIQMARIWARAKQVDLAVPKLEEAIRLSPNDARPIKDLYELYIQQRQYAKVVPLLEKYISLIGTDIDAKVRLVKFLTFQAKDYDRAISEGEKLLLTNPDQYTLHRWLAWSYTSKAKQLEIDQETDTSITDEMIKMNYAKGKEQSNKLFDAVAKDNNRKVFPEDYDFWALSTLKTGNIDEAAHIYRKYIEFDTSKAPDVYGTLAKTYYDSANYLQAIAYYKRAAAIKPLTITQDFYLGQSYYVTKQYEGADSSFVRILELSPTYAVGYQMRARIADKIDSTDNKLYLAKPHWDKYLEIAEPEQAKNIKGIIEAYEYLGVYYGQTNDLTRAKEIFQKLAAIDPGNETATYNLAILKR